MATSPVIDLDSLSTPVSDELPAGQDMRAASRREQDQYGAVRDARNKAIQAEKQLRDYASLTEEDRKRDSLASPEPPDWEAVRRQSIEVLTKSKDLWITTWLIEALTRLHGFAGLRDGIRLAHLLCEKFRDDVHPRANDDRFAKLGGLDLPGSGFTFVDVLMNVPITAPQTIRPCSCADYKDAADLERKDPKIRSRRVEQGAITMDMFERAMAETNVGFFENLLEDLQQANEAMANFTTLLAARVSDKAALPPSSRIRETLDDCLRLCRSLTKDILHREKPDGGEVAVTTSPAKSGSTDGSGVETRQDALRTLLRVSEYFRRTEPHSPVSYALEQAVRWAHMPLPDLLSELVTDKGARDEIFKRAGIPKPPEK